MDGRKDNVKTVYPPQTKFAGGIMIKYLSNEHKIEGAHFQCVNNHYTKFEYIGMKTVGVTDYTNQTQSKDFGQKND